MISSVVDDTTESQSWGVLKTLALQRPPREQTWWVHHTNPTRDWVCCPSMSVSDCSAWLCGSFSLSFSVRHVRFLPGEIGEKKTNMCFPREPIAPSDVFHVMLDEKNRVTIDRWTIQCCLAWQWRIVKFHDAHLFPWLCHGEPVFGWCERVHKQYPTMLLKKIFC